MIYVAFIDSTISGCPDLIIKPAGAQNLSPGRVHDPGVSVVAVPHRRGQQFVAGPNAKAMLP
jgi:hypothetical protein